MRYSLAVILLLTFAVCAAAQTSLKVGSSAPQFSGESLDGGYYDLENLRGKVVIITFWSTKCEICRHEIPKLNAVMQRYEKTNVEFLGLTMDKEEKLNEYLKGVPFRFHILPDSFGAVLQYADRDRSGAINMGFPAYFLIDVNGKVAFRGSGWDRTDELTSKLDLLLSSPTTSIAP